MPKLTKENMKVSGRYQTIRTITLITVHIYIVFHLLAWYVFDWPIWGKTAMVGALSLPAGNINAAAIMVALILLSMFLYGRFFCGWLCHMRGVVEFADWVMRKMNLSGYIKLRQRNLLLNTRYRWTFRVAVMLILLSPVLFLYLQGSPQLNLDPAPLAPMADLPGYEGKLFNEKAPVNVDLEFTVAGVLTGLAFVILIQFVMSFFLNYFYGQGAFCRVLCPYTVLFVPLMNLSPWQKKITRTTDCTGCRKCSSHCPQGIDVSREIFHNHGKVTNLECIKCYRCVDICEHGVLKDSREKAWVQIKPRKEYERRPWINEHRHLQIYQPLSPLVDGLSIVVAVIAGFIAAQFGGFWFYVGSILGFVISRKIALILFEKLS